MTYKASIEPVSAALKAPLDKKAAIDRINKTGDTDFEFSHIKAQIGENVFVPNGALNKLRRDAISGLCDKLLKSITGMMHDTLICQDLQHSLSMS